MIATDFQGHGRTDDTDRPLSTAGLTGDVVALLEHLGVGPVDVFGYSIGGAVALQLAVEHPDLVRKAIISSVSFDPSGDRGSDNADAVAEMTVVMIAGARHLVVTRRDRLTTTDHDGPPVAVRDRAAPRLQAELELRTNIQLRCV